MRTEVDRLSAVYDCLAQALALDDAERLALTPDTSAADLKKWDSMGHVRLMLAIEERFGIQLRDEQVVELVSVGAIVRAVAAAP